MKTTRIALAFLPLIALCLPSFAQSRRIGGGTASTDKYGVYFETFLDPSTPEIANVGGGSTAPDSGGIIHRFMLDQTRRVYFGYDVSIEVLPEPNTYRATFGQLTIPPQFTKTILGDNPSAWTPMSTPAWGGPTPRRIRAGEVVQLNLLTNFATGQRIIDYVTVQEPPRGAVTFANVNTPPREFAFAPGFPRDFRADDGVLNVRAPRLSINGKFDPSTTALNTDASGSVVWIYIANRGRFLLSLTPHPDLGFRKAGDVRGSTLNFTEGPDAFNLVASGPIAPTQAAFNLYVFHDPTWKPTYPFANLSAFNMGAADRAESLIRK